MPDKQKKKTQFKDIKTKIIEAALHQAALLGWEHTTLQDIADEAKISMADLHTHFEDKFDILAGLGRLIDHKALEHAGKPDPESTTRDHLFDILMDRFEILNKYRDGVVAILASFKGDPKLALISSPHLCRSMCWMLESSGISTYGVKGAIKVAGLSGLYLKVLRVWKKDDTPDLSKTMAALDKELSRAESFANSFGF